MVQTCCGVLLPKAAAIFCQRLASTSSGGYLTRQSSSLKCIKIKNKGMTLTKQPYSLDYLQSHQKSSHDQSPSKDSLTSMRLDIMPCSEVATIEDVLISSLDVYDKTLSKKLLTSLKFYRYKNVLYFFLL